jgi:hypothetical protein
VLLDTEPVVRPTDHPVVVAALQEEVPQEAAEAARQVAPQEVAEAVRQVADMEVAEAVRQVADMDPQVAAVFLQAEEVLPLEDTPDLEASIGTMAPQEVVVDHQEVEVEVEVDQAVLT